ncbi:MAG: hypothetical protein ACC645_20540 [Pirellulales bacterium]
MNRLDNAIYLVADQFQNLAGSQSLYALAAVLVVYVFIVFGRAK